jgi:hypothetical protein
MIRKGITELVVDALLSLFTSYSGLSRLVEILFNHLDPTNAVSMSHTMREMV